MSTIAELIHARAKQDGIALLFEDRSWTWGEFAAACAERAELLRTLRRPGPFHVAVLLDNVPEYPMWFGAAALIGATIVGLNSSRRGAELARDIAHTECQLILTEDAHQQELEGLSLALGQERILNIDHASYSEMLGAHAGASLPRSGVKPDALLELLFTSGTSGAPKACLVSQGRQHFIAEKITEINELTREDICYQAMPAFHANALNCNVFPALFAGATMALRRRFSASAFLPDIRRFEATYANYVGKVLAYILATPEKPDDGDNPLRRVYGNEGADRDIEAFAARFGCAVRDGYGSTEGGAAISRVPGMPEGALGLAAEGHVVLDPESGQECPRARFDEDGKLVNAEAAIGELVNLHGGAGFEGYWKNEEANAERVRGGAYWTGDLVYRDEAGYFYFAGRSSDWLRVDGENFAAAPVERILARFPGVALAAVYAVPDPLVGDQVMAALQLQSGAQFDPDAFARFLDLQPALGTKWAPRFLRVTRRLPVTSTNKLLKRELRRERWECAEPVWWRPPGAETYRRLTERDTVRIRDEFAARGRLSVLESL